MSKYAENYQDLSREEAKQFANSILNEFQRLEAWGPRGVLQQADLSFTSWKRLQPSDRSSLDYRLIRQYDVKDVEFLRELGKRHAIANAGLSSFSASARLHILSQPSAAFERFLAVMRQQDRMPGHAVRSAIVEASTFPRDEWLGLTPKNDKK